MKFEPYTIACGFQEALTVGRFCCLSLERWWISPRWEPQPSMLSQWLSRRPQTWLWSQGPRVWIGQRVWHETRSRSSWTTSSLLVPWPRLTSPLWLHWAQSNQILSRRTIGIGEQVLFPWSWEWWHSIDMYHLMMEGQSRMRYCNIARDSPFPRSLSCWMTQTCGLLILELVFTALIIPSVWLIWGPHEMELVWQWAIEKWHRSL